jgi:CheY-like chemotaxis protein
MTASLLSLPLSSPIPGLLKKKRVLLVDGSPAKRELRAEAMRRLGMDVDCACDISEARSWWRADLYNLVLVNMEHEMDQRDRFCNDVRTSTIRQHLAFFVGKPEYLADTPGTESEVVGGYQTKDEMTPAPELSSGSNQRWGIMEASRRISAVRSVSVARTTALRNRPTPPRDLEVRLSKRAEAESQLLSAFQKEEVQ